MSVQYEFLLSVYSTPPFITEILMVFLVIVILGFPCTSYLSRYVRENSVLPSEAPPEIRRESSGVVIEELEATLPPQVSDTEIRPESSGVVIEERQATIPPQVGESEIWPESSRVVIEERQATIPPQVGAIKIWPESSGAVIEERQATIPPQVGDTEIQHGPVIEGLQATIPPEVGDNEIRQESSGLLIEDLLYIPPLNTIFAGTYRRGRATEPGKQPEPGLVIESDRHPEPGQDIEPDEPDPESEHDSDATKSRTDDSNADDSGSDNSGPDDPGPGGTGTGPNDPGPEEPGGYESSQNDIQGPTQMEVVEVHRNRESFRQNTSGVSRKQGTKRSIQVLYSISNYPELSHSETEEYQSPHHKYFRTANSALENMFMEGNMHSVVHDIVGDSITPRNEIQRGQMGSLYKQQTGNISTGSAISKDFKFQNLIAEESFLLPEDVKTTTNKWNSTPDALILSHKEETSSHDNFFTSVSSSPLFINKYNRKLADSSKMKHKRIRQRSNQRYAGTNASNKSQQFIPCTEHLLSELLRLKQYELLKRKEETASQEKSLTSASCSPVFTNNTKQAGSLEMRLKRRHHSSKLARRNESQKIQHFIPHTEHSMTGETTDQEKYNCYNRGLKRKCSFESKDSEDNYKGSYENADWIKTGPNTCCYSAVDKLGSLRKDRTHPLTEEDSKTDKDPFYFKSYSQSETFQHSMNRGSIGKFKSSSDVSDAESTASDKYHKIRIEEARLFVELIKEVHRKNIRMKSKSKLQEKCSYCPQFSSDEISKHYPPGKSNEQNIGDNNAKSVSETIKVSELKYFHKST